MKLSLLILTSLLIAACTGKPIAKSNPESWHADSAVAITAINKETPDADTIPMKPPFIMADIDGDFRQDSVIIAKEGTTGKEGLKIVFARGVTEFLGMGKKIAGQDFDDISWAGEFRKVSKDSLFVDNVDENGDFIDIDKIPKSKWTKLPADGIYLHYAESCGGGIIYRDKGSYKWIQQE